MLAELRDIIDVTLRRLSNFLSFILLTPLTMLHKGQVGAAKLKIIVFVYLHVVNVIVYFNEISFESVTVPEKVLSLIVGA